MPGFVTHIDVHELGNIFLFTKFCLFIFSVFLPYVCLSLVTSSFSSSILIYNFCLYLFIFFLSHSQYLPHHHSHLFLLPLFLSVSWFKAEFFKFPSQLPTVTFSSPCLSATPTSKLTFFFYSFYLLLSWKPVPLCLLNYSHSCSAFFSSSLSQTEVSKITGVQTKSLSFCLRTFWSQGFNRHSASHSLETASVIWSSKELVKMCHVLKTFNHCWSFSQKEARNWEIASRAFITVQSLKRTGFKYQSLIVDSRIHKVTIDLGSFIPGVF